MSLLLLNSETTIFCMYDQIFFILITSFILITHNDVFCYELICGYCCFENQILVWIRDFKAKMISFQTVLWLRDRVTCISKTKDALILWYCKLFQVSLCQIYRSKPAINIYTLRRKALVKSTD